MSERIVAHAQRVRAQLPNGIAALIGVSGCQGSGKTYNSQRAVAELQAQGIKAIAISLDDYYIDHKSQLELRSKGNPLLAKRGLPGTHNVQALATTLEALRQYQTTQVLQYDKSRFNGEGDRCDSIVAGPVDVVILEGWMLGFEALGKGLKPRVEQSPHASQYQLAQIEQVDKNLVGYAQIWSLLDALILMKADSLDNIYTWRLQQEHAMIAKLGSGMTDDQVRAFVDGYMPAYELYLDFVKATETLVLDLSRKVVK